MAVALLVAAGSGERLGAPVPKAFVALAGRPMLEWSLDALRAAGIHDVVVAAPCEVVHDGIAGGGDSDTAGRGGGARGRGGDGAADGGLAALRAPGVRVVPGGATRSASVRAALAAAPPGDMVVHDAARPLVTPEHFTAALAALAEADCAITAAPMTDTVKEAGPDRWVTATHDRSRLWAIQTPQAFRRATLERALDVDEATLARATDDAWLVERAGGTVRVVESSPANLKVTTPHDLRIADLLLADRLPRAPAPRRAGHPA